MILKRLEPELTVCKVADAGQINLQADFCFVGKTDEELSVVCRTEDAPAAEESAPEAEVPAEPEPADSEKPDGNGFQQLFPEEPAEDEPIPPTEIRFGNGVKIHEYPEYFLVYLVRSNFYVIPKKDFSEDETAQLRKIFGLA